MNQDDYLKDRVDDQIGWYGKAANRTKKAHVRIQTTVIVLALLVPVLANLPDPISLLRVSVQTQILVTVASLLVAILNGLANFRKHGDLWLSYRMTEEMLKHEKYLFITSSGKYAGLDNPLSLFVENVESIISVEHEKFRSLIESATRPTAAGAAAKAPPTGAD